MSWLSERHSAPISVERSIHPGIAVSVGVHAFAVLMLLWHPDFRIKASPPEIPAEIKITIGNNAQQNGAPPPGQQSPSQDAAAPTPPAPRTEPGILPAPPPPPPQPPQPQAERRVARQGQPSPRADVRLGDGVATPFGILDHEQPDDTSTPDQFNILPAYPPEAARNRETGMVVLELHIDETGQVAQIDLVESSGSAALDRVTIEALRKWKYRPAIHNGRPVPSIRVQRVEYR